MIIVYYKDGSGYMCHHTFITKNSPCIDCGCSYEIALKNYVAIKGGENA